MSDTPSSARAIITVNGGLASVAFTSPDIDVMVLDFDALAQDLASQQDVDEMAQRLGIEATGQGFADFYLEGFVASDEASQRELDHVRDAIVEIVADAQR